MKDVELKIPNRILVALDAMIETYEKFTGDPWTRDEFICVLICEKFEKMWGEDEDHEAVDLAFEALADLQFQLLTGGK